MEMLKVKPIAMIRLWKKQHSFLWHFTILNVSMSRAWISDLAHKGQLCEARLIQLELSWSNDSTFIWVHFCEMMALCAPTWQWPMMMATIVTIVAWPLWWSFPNAGYRVGEAVGLWVSHKEKIRGYGIFRTFSKPSMNSSCSVSPFHISLHDVISGCFPFIACF